MKLDLKQLAIDFGYTEKEIEHFQEFAIIWLKQKRRQIELKHNSTAQHILIDELLEELEK